jgi:membrane protein DedA with SNARE-associated domain
MIIAKSIFILLTLLVVVEKNEAALYSDSLEYAQLSTYSALNEKIENIATSFVPQLSGSERTRILVLNFRTQEHSISILGSYVRAKLSSVIRLSEGFEIVDSQLIIKELLERKIPIGSSFDNATAISLGNNFFADAVITGEILFENASLTISATLVTTEDSSVTMKAFAIPSDERLVSFATKNTSDYEQELHEIQYPENKIGMIEEYMTKFIEKLGKMKPFWIYLIISFIAFIENIFPPFPSDGVVVFGGFLAGVGKISYIVLLLTSTIGSTLGFMLAYHIGVKCSKAKISQLKNKYIPVDALIKVGAWFSKYGYWLIIVNRFLAGTRAVISFFAGLSGLPFLITIVLSFVSALAWNTLLLYGGLKLGRNWHQALDVMGRYSHLLLYVIIGLALLGVAVSLLRNKKKASSLVQKKSLHN